MGDERDDMVQQGLDHLQAAAHEVIDATRSLLDAAEALVDDPRAIQGLVGTLTSVAQAVAARLRPTDPMGPDGDDSGTHVQRIKVS